MESSGIEFQGEADRQNQKYAPKSRPDDAMTGNIIDVSPLPGTARVLVICRAALGSASRPRPGIAAAVAHRPSS